MSLKSKNKLIFLIISQQNQWLLYLGIFFAPVKVEHNRSEKDLLHIVKYDNNPFNRWDSSQQIAKQKLKGVCII
ncbi:hypothetical protein A2G94_02110 [Francisella endosymbiont of Ornithodoros moubata]|nr:hypothetical protein A2G94_02110 [Francisella endosymbiont of Ornithodoros moubata]